jgi:hypothetical protein
MKTLILAAFAVLSLSVGSAYARSSANQPAPSVHTFDSDWVNG